LTDRIAQSDDTGDIEHDLRTREVALDKELLQLVQGACKADNLQRALDITRIMHNPATVEAAGKVAAFYHLPGLQERIHDVKAEVEERRYREKRARRAGDSSSGYANGSGAHPGRAKPAGFSDFAPKAGKRSFGGVPPGTGTPASLRDTTPMASGRSVKTYIPETPDVNGRVDETPAPEDEGYGSPDAKRRRVAETPVDDFVVPKKRVDEFSVPPSTNGQSDSRTRCRSRANEQAQRRTPLRRSRRPRTRSPSPLWLNPSMRSKAPLSLSAWTTSSRAALRKVRGKVDDRRVSQLIFSCKEGKEGEGAITGSETDDSVRDEEAPTAHPTRAPGEHGVDGDGRGCG